MLIKWLHESPARSNQFFIILALVVGAVAGILVAKLNEPLFIVFGVIGIIGVVGAIMSAQLGLLLMVFITYTRMSDIAVHYHGAPSIAKSFVVLLIVVILIRWALFHERPDGWQLPSVLIIVYGLVGLSSILYAVYPDNVIEILGDYFKDALICIIVAIMIRNKVLFRRTVWILVFSGIFLGTISIFQYLTSSFTNVYGGFAQANYQQISGETMGYRLAGPIGDANFFAQAMLVLVPISLERVLHEKNGLLRFFAVWGSVASALTVILTYSRGGFLAMSLTILVFLFIYPPRIQTVPYIIILGLVVLSLIPKEFTARLLSMDEILNAVSVGFKTQDKAIQGRASENATAFEMFKAHPFLGIGWGNYIFQYQDYSQSLGIAPTAEDRAAHNLYLEILSESGIIGFTTFMTIVWQAGRVMLQARKRFILSKEGDFAGLVTGVAIAFMGYMIAALFVHAAFPRYFYLLIGIAFSLKNVLDNDLKIIPSRIGK